MLIIPTSVSTVLRPLRYLEILPLFALKDPFYIDGKGSELGTSYHIKCFARKHPGTDFSKYVPFLLDLFRL